MKYSLENYQEDYVEIRRGDKTVFTIEAYHKQDCCECVYAEFSALEDTNTEIASGYSMTLDDVVKNIVGVPESGVKVFGHFIPCYNEQNGYYSSDLVLRVKDTKTKRELTINITDYVEDRID